MHKLDDNDCEMTDNYGNKTERDLVQFVEFAKYGNNGVKLAKEVFFELPRQVEEYNQLVGLNPEDYAGKTDAEFMAEHYAKGVRHSGPSFKNSQSHRINERGY